MTNEKPETAVERFTDTYTTMTRYPTGDWVRYSDYAALQARVAELEAQPVACGGYIQDVLSRSIQAASKAQIKFPQPNYVSLKIAEEAGELVRACVHYAEDRLTWEELEGEAVDTIAMVIRLLAEGDEVNGVLIPHEPIYLSTLTTRTEADLWREAVAIIEDNIWKHGDDSYSQGDDGGKRRQPNE